MIRCPKCGTMNRDGSRFCNECGAQLQQTKIRCPKCGTLNPVGNIFCDNCNARLVPASGVVPPEQTSEEEAGRAGMQSISLPTIPSAKEGAGEDEEDLPDWLLGLDDDEAAEPVPSQANGAEDEEGEEEFPDWLSSIWGDEEGAEPVAEPAPEVQEEGEEEALPDWLSGLPGEEEAASEAPETEESLAPSELPAWLSGMEEGEEATPSVTPSEGTEAAEDVAPDALPDWLAGGEAEPETREPAAPTPEPAAPETPGPAPDADLPDWLLATADASQPQPEASGKVPDWLFADADEEPFPEPKASGPLPDWLSGASPAGGESRPQPEPDETEEDWMGDLLSEEPEPEEPVAPEAAEVPDWLAGAAEEEPEAAPEEPVAPEAGEMPDWLAGVEGEEPEAAPAAQPEPEEEPTPDWLSGLMEGEPEAEAPEAAPAPEPEAAEAEEAEADIPAWLSGLADDEGALEEAQAPEEMPDWLSGIESEEAPAFEEAVSGQEAPAAADLPDWLADVGGAPEAPEAEMAPEPEEAKAAPPEALETEAPAPEEAAEQEGADWVQGLGPEEAEEAPAEAEDLARAELPSWLQGLRPPGTGPLPSLPEDRAEAAAEEAGGLAPAEIPEWVRQLRPAPTAEGKAPAEKVAPIEPAEQAGPLADLPGVLPSSPIVDVPEAYQPISQPAFPDDVVEQAKLWQQLLEQPRSVERPIAQRRAERGAGTLVARLIVVVFLIAVTVVGLLGVLGEPGLAQAVHKPRVMDLRVSLEGLQPDDTVIVAVEYGPAEAGEMTPIATALLEHLREKDVDVIAVSSLPEGVALIPGLLRTTALSNTLGPERSPYLPGRYNGIGLFLGEPLAEDADLLLVVAARAERLRWWVEQNLASTRAQDRAPLPMDAGVSASIGALTAPYLESAPVEGWLAGFSDMVAYREGRGQPRDDALARQLDSLMLAHWVALGLILCGFIYYLISGRKGTI